MALDPALDLTLWFVPELGNASYVLTELGSGRTVLVDPARDVETYRAFLGPGRSAQLTALDTHIHNDFVSGARELSALHEGEAGESAYAEIAYPHRSLKAGERLPLGDWTLEVLATPGHTPEHVSYLLRSPQGTERALFSGGALMVGGAARTDLLGPEQARPLARGLYRSLGEKVSKLAASTWVLPTHQGGSFCGAVRGDRHTSTMREERATNPLLKARDFDAFLRVILAQGPYPAYFRRMRKLNSSVPEHASGEAPVPRSLPLERFDRLRAEGAAVIDLREPSQFDARHIPGSLSVPVDGPFSSWVGWLLPPERPLLFVATTEEEAKEGARQLFRIGYDQVVGMLGGGLRVWEEDGRAVAKLPWLDGPGLERALASAPAGVVLDVREAHEWFEGHVPGSVNIPVAALTSRVGELSREVPLWVHCSRGYRSSIASSLLEAAGFQHVVHIRGELRALG